MIKPMTDEELNDLLYLTITPDIVERLRATIKDREIAAIEATKQRVGKLIGLTCRQVMMDENELVVCGMPHEHILCGNCLQQIVEGCLEKERARVKELEEEVKELEAGMYYGFEED